MTILKMTGWVTDKLEKLPAAEVFQLFHTTEGEFGNGGVELLLRRTVDMSNSRSLEEEATAISEEMQEMVRVHLESYGGTHQRYKLEALGDDDNQLGQYPFMKGAPTKKFSDNIGTSEPSNERGLLGQLMRHNESLLRMNVEMVEAVITPLVEENQALRKQRDGWEDKRLEWHLKLESLTSDELSRKIEFDEFERGEKRKDQAIELLLKVALPEVIKRFTLSKQPALKEGVSPVAKYQAVLRDILKLIDRGVLYSALDNDTLALLDDLLGTGEHPETEEAFSEKLKVVWSSLPGDVITSIQNVLAEKDPAKLALLATLLGIDVAAEAKKAAATIDAEMQDAATRN